MAISRAQLLKELLPGLNALFGMEYKRYGEEHKEIYETESSERSFEEETKLSGFGAAPVKNEGTSIAYDNAQEAFTARYTHETIALGFSITEEAVEDNLYDSLSGRYTKALARGMRFSAQRISGDELHGVQSCLEIRSDLVAVGSDTGAIDAPHVRFYVVLLSTQRQRFAFAQFQITVYAGEGSTIENGVECFVGDYGRIAVEVNGCLVEYNVFGSNTRLQLNFIHHEAV